MKELATILASPCKEWLGDKSERYSKWAFAILAIGILLSGMLE